MDNCGDGLFDWGFAVSPAVTAGGKKAYIMSKVIDIARELVRIPSVNPAYDASSPGEGGVVAWLRDWAQKHGIDCHTEAVFPGRENLFMTIENGPGPRLMFNGHTDTVSIEGMEIEPFSGEVRDGRLHGRGSADMKGPLACMLMTLLALKENLSAWQGRLTVSFVVDEEVRFSGVQDMMKRHTDYDYAIVGEPTGLNVLRGCKGVLRFKLGATGLSAHSSTPEKGRSAIVAMAEAVLALDDFFSRELASRSLPNFGPSTGSVGLIRGGSGINIVPETSEIEVDIRLIPGQVGRETWEKIQQTVRQSSQRVPGIEWHFDPDPFIDEAYETPADHRLVTTVRDTLGRNGSNVALYTCDASKISRAGVPCIILGPGNIADAHTANESVAVKDLEDGVDVYRKVACALLRC